MTFRDGINKGEAYFDWNTYQYIDPNAGNTTGLNDGTITSADIMQINSYYPFGLNMEGNWNGAAGNNKYAYNGKEWNDDFGLGWNDYGARFYDPAVARWGSVDPMAEKMWRHSPYNYAFNNPVRFVDRDGMVPEPPDGDVAWIWSTPSQENGKYYQNINYQNISAERAMEYNRINAANEGRGVEITKTTYNNLAEGTRGGAREGHQAPDESRGSVPRSQDIGQGKQTFKVDLPASANSASVNVNYDMSGLEDNVKVSFANTTTESGNVVGVGMVGIDNTDLSNAPNEVRVTVTPMDPNPNAPMNFNPSIDSQWQLTVNYQINIPVYSSQSSNSTRSNSTQGEVLGVSYTTPKSK